ncbi:MAG: hypothetical protein AB7E95_10100 [Kiritimatiellales bacterium]
MKLTQSYRLSEEDKKALEKLANNMKIPAGQIVAVLVETYIEAKKQHGKKLIWPPEFNYFTNSETEQDAQDKRDASAKAG